MKTGRKKILNQMVRFSLVWSSLMLTVGCKLLLGIDSTPKWQIDEEHRALAQKMEIPLEHYFILDTVSYNKGLKSLYNPILQQLKENTSDSAEYQNQKMTFKDDTQPVQFRLFDSKGDEIFKIVNCYVDKPIAADWNVEHCMDVFPPKIKYQSLNTHNFNLDFLLSHTAKLGEQSAVIMNSLPKADYYGVIVWNRVYKKYAKKLIETVRKKVVKSSNSVVLLYITNHNEIMWNNMSTGDKEKVKEALK